MTSGFSSKVLSWADVPERHSVAMVEWDRQYGDVRIDRIYYNLTHVWVVDDTTSTGRHSWTIYDWIPELGKWVKWQPK